MEFKGLQIKENFPLRDFSTFRIGGPARFYIEINKASELPLVFDFIKVNNLDHFILGGGSNLLISDLGIDGLVINLNIKGLEMVESDSNFTWLKIGSGEVWDKVVAWAVDKNLWGIENLSLIPGRAGGFVVQNVGAYGQEASQVIESVEVFDSQEGKGQSLTNKDCEFSYRQTIFNTKARGRYIIVSMVIKLANKAKPNLTYPDVIKYFQARQIDNPGLRQIRQAIIDIRKAKFPPLLKVGNAGSFFKNVVLEAEDYQKLEARVKQEFGQDKLIALRRVVRDVGDNKMKVPTAFIIDKLLRLKGQRVGGARIYDKQALVIVNDSGKASAKDVMNLFKQVRQQAYIKTGLRLEPEPNLVGFKQAEIDNYFSLDD